MDSFKLCSNSGRLTVNLPLLQIVNSVRDLYTVFTRRAISLNTAPVGYTKDESRVVVTCRLLYIDHYDSTKHR